MSSFKDEVEIQEAAIRTAVLRLGLEKLGGVLFLAVTYEDERGYRAPPEKLMSRLGDLAIIRPYSRGRPLPPAEGRRPDTMIDTVTGETGWRMLAGTRRWQTDGAAEVTVQVQYVVYPRVSFDRGEWTLAFAAVARRREGRWELEPIYEQGWP